MSSSGNSSLDGIRREKLRSRNSRQHAFAAFVNMTQKDVALEWLDFEGNHVSYKERLGPSQVMRMNTFVGHPWIFYEADSRHPLATLPDRKTIYMPLGYEGGPPSYRPVFIVNPLLSLQQICLKFLHMHLINSGQQRSDMFDQNLDKLKNNMEIHEHHCKLLCNMERNRLDKNVPFYINASTVDD